MRIQEHWIIYKTLLNREIIRVLRIWPQTLLPSVITITLYFLIFGKVFGEKVGNVNGCDYMHFITPGLIIMAVINNSFINVVSSFFSARFSRSIEELFVSPAPNYLIILGYISGGIFRGLSVGTLVSVVAFLFDGFSFPIHSYLLVIITFFCCGTLFSLGGLLNGIFSKKFDDTTIFSAFVLIPLVYLGGIFYSLNELPPIWQSISKCNPLFYIVDFVRFSFSGAYVVSPYVSFLSIIALIIILYAFAWYLIYRGFTLKP